MYGNCRKQSLIEPVLFILFLNNKMSIKRVFIVDLQASVQPSHVFFLKEIQIYVTGNNCWEQLSKLFRLFCTTKRQPKCMYLFETYHRHCNPKEKKKAPSVICCSDLSEPLRFNAWKEAKSSSQRACFEKCVIL